MDDTYVNLEHGSEELVRFFDHLNNQSNHIKFRMKQEKDCSLPFLDVMVIINNDGTMGYKVYKKKIHID